LCLIEKSLRVINKFVEFAAETPARNLFRRQAETAHDLRINEGIPLIVSDYPDPQAAPHQFSRGTDERRRLAGAEKATDAGN